MSSPRRVGDAVGPLVPADYTGLVIPEKAPHSRPGGGGAGTPGHGPGYDRGLTASRPEVTMRWRDMRDSDNVEDREGAGPAGGGLGGGVKLGGAGLIVVVALSLLFGLNPLDVLTSLQ